MVHVIAACVDEAATITPHPLPFELYGYRSGCPMNRNFGAHVCHECDFLLRRQHTWHQAIVVPGVIVTRFKAKQVERCRHAALVPELVACGLVQHTRFAFVFVAPLLQHVDEILRGRLVCFALHYCLPSSKKRGSTVLVFSVCDKGEVVLVGDDDARIHGRVLGVPDAHLGLFSKELVAPLF